MKITTNFLSIFFIAFFFISCESTNSPDKQISTYEDAVNFSISKLNTSLNEVPQLKYPIRTKGFGEWELTESSAWTSGFYPGCLWYANQLVKDKNLEKQALQFTEGLEDQQFNTNHHDIGFMMLNSYGHAFEQIGNDKYKNILLQSANSLSTRFNKNVGCIQSWNGDFQVIIDNMMNLELLFWASKNGGDQTFYDIAVSHADKTIENHLRKDGSLFHVVVYDANTGEVLQRKTHQGYSDSSAWARGQAWGIYGFTMTFRETNDKKYLDAAEKIAEYFINHLPSDYVPYWDLNLPENDDRQYKDASAATIALSAFLELRNYIENTSKYDDLIEIIFNSLFSDYISVNTNTSGIINHCAYNCNSKNPYDWDASTIWGDYYFLEALVRYKQLN